jgi:hypothetical protein
MQTSRGRTSGVRPGCYGPPMGGDLPRLRLVWSRQESPPAPRVNLARAIERHLAGEDGLSDEQFLLLFATGFAHRRDTLRRVPPLRAVSRPREVG